MIKLIGLLKRRPGVTVAKLGVFAVPLLLLIPALYYSLDTPIGLFERKPHLAHKFDSASDFLRYLRTTFMEAGSLRFRPFFDVWNGLVWRVFGDVAWPHHFSRWLLHFGAVAFFIAAYRRFSSPLDALHSPAGSLLQIVPPALLAYLWLFFPNVPTVRIEAVEVHTIFFLGLCNWAAAAVLAAEKNRPALGWHTLFCLGYLGLLLSKEVNVAPALWLLACWWALAIARGPTAGKLLVGVALTLALVVAVHRVGVTLETAELRQAYFVSSSPVLDRFPQNATVILQGLFQYYTSADITVAFVFLLLALAGLAVARFARRGFDGELAFVLLLFGELASMFFMLCLLYGMPNRYWSVLVPCLAALLAFAAKFLLVAAKRRKALANTAAVALAAFIAFFVLANYHNFLYQIVVQHSARNVDDLVIAEVAQLLNSGKYVQANPNGLPLEEMKILRQMGRRYERHWPNSPYGKRSIHGVPPKDPRQPYLLLDLGRQPALAGNIHARFAGRSDYGLLDYAAKAAHFLQGAAPHVSLDSGLRELGKYHWTIFAMPHNADDSLHQLTAQAGELVAQSVFDLYFDGDRITYFKRPCLKEDVEDWFFLHLAPVRESDLPKARRRYGFDNLDFLFWDYGIRIGEACLAVRTLPQYPIKNISTGQYIVEEDARAWEMDFRVRD